jgi:hypothetical protein
MVAAFILIGGSDLMERLRHGAADEQLQFGCAGLNGRQDYCSGNEQWHPHPVLPQ